MSRLLKETEELNLTEYTNLYLVLAEMTYNNDAKLYNELFREDVDLVLLEAGSRLNPRKISDNIKRTDKKVSSAIDSKFDKLLKDLRKRIIGASREELINNRTKLSTVIKRVTVVGVSAYLNPILGLIALYTQVVVRKGLKEREKNRILADIKGELEIVEEKIKDADNNNDRNKKYELMRLRRELKKQEEKIRYARFIKD